MSGHNKWSTIKHKKAKEDAKRGKAFTKLIKELTVAARVGGGDPDGNPRLRTAVEKARAGNMPKEHIERAILKGSGDLEGVTYEDKVYEGYGPDGVALMIVCTTDNKNRTVAEVRHLLNKYNGNLGTDGSVSWMFNTVGQVIIEAKGVDEDALMEVALEAGAEDVELDEDIFTVTCEPADLPAVSTGLKEAGYEFVEAEVTKVPTTTKKLTGKVAKQMYKLWELLDEHDDVQNVYHNFELDEATMEELGA